MVWGIPTLSGQSGVPEGPLAHPLWRHRVASDPRGLDWASFQRYESQGVWGSSAGSLPGGHVYLGEGWNLGQATEQSPYLYQHKAATLDPETRTMHMQVMGNTGSGKSHFLRHLIQQDITAGHGLCVIDPHGELVEHVLRFCMDRGEKDRGLLDRLVVMSAPRFPEYVLGYNPLAHLTGSIQFHAKEMTDACLMAWNVTDPTSTPRLSRLMSLTFTALLMRAEIRQEPAQMRDALHLLSLRPDNPFRLEMLEYLQDEPFMQEQLMILTDMKRSADLLNQVESTMGRLYGFLSNPFINATFHAPNSINIRQIMDEGKILLCDLSRGKREGVLPEQDAVLLAGFLQGHLYNCAMQRDEDDKPFFIYVDEFGSFLSRAVVKGLPQTRKRNVGYILGHQYQHQLRHHDDDVLEAVTNATRTKVIFGGLGDSDRQSLAQEMWGAFFDPKLIKHEQKMVSQFENAEPVRFKTASGGTSKTMTEAQGRVQGTTNTEGYGHSSASTTGEARGGPTSPISWEEWERSGKGHDIDRYLSYMQNYRGPDPSQNSSESYTQNNNHSVANMQQDSRTKSMAEGSNSGWGESLHFPKYIKEQVTSVQFYSLEDQLAMAKRMFALLDRGEALVRLAGVNLPPFLLSVPPIPLPPLSKAEREEMLAMFYKMLFKRQPALHKQAGAKVWLPHAQYKQMPPPGSQKTPAEAAKEFYSDKDGAWRYGDDDIVPVPKPRGRKPRQ